MKRRGQEPGLHLAMAALGVQEGEAVEELDVAGATDARVEIFEICAASESYVLTIVDMFAVGQHVRGCAAAKKGALFKQTHAPAGFSQRDASCQSRQPAADHDHAFQGYSLPCGGRSAPWQRTSSFPLWEAAHARRRRQSRATRGVRARRCKYEPAATTRRGYQHRSARAKQNLLHRVAKRVRLRSGAIRECRELLRCGQNLPVKLRNAAGLLPGYRLARGCESRVRRE